MSSDETADEVKRKAGRIRRRRDRPATWRHLAHVGVLGWVFVLPTVACAWLGHWIAVRSDRLWPAIVGVAAGVVLGTYLVWRNLREALDEFESPEDEGDGKKPRGV